LPVTTNQVGAAPDLVRHVENGFIYPVGDVEKLGDRLLELLSDKENRMRMGQKSLDIISKWSYEEDIEGILSALKYFRIIG
jgi:glycosyltransferase involved in cell wall biosynthesis